MRGTDREDVDVGENAAVRMINKLIRKRVAFAYDGEILLSEASTDEVAQAKWMGREEIVSLYYSGKWPV